MELGAWSTFQESKEMRKVQLPGLGCPAVGTGSRPTAELLIPRLFYHMTSLGRRVQLIRFKFEEIRKRCLIKSDAYL